MWPKLKVALSHMLTSTILAPLHVFSPNWFPYDDMNIRTFFYLFKIGISSWSGLNSARLHNAAILARCFHVDDFIWSNKQMVNKFVYIHSEIKNMLTLHYIIHNFCSCLPYFIPCHVSCQIDLQWYQHQQSHHQTTCELENDTNFCLFIRHFLINTMWFRFCTLG